MMQPAGIRTTFKNKLFARATVKAHRKDGMKKSHSREIKNPAPNPLKGTFVNFFDHCILQTPSKSPSGDLGEGANADHAGARNTDNLKKTN
jgi:hypothetical protein